MAPRRTFPALALAAATALLSLGGATPAEAAVCAGADLVPATGNLAQVADATHCLLNEQRAAAGLAPTRQNPKLAQAGVGYSRRMVAERFFGHVAPDGEDLSTRLLRAGYIAASDEYTIGENLAWGQRELSTPRAIVAAWMQSPGHRANVLRPQYAEVGLGFVIGTPADPSQGATVTAEYGLLETVAATPRRTRRCASARTSRARARARTTKAARKPARRTCAVKPARRTTRV
jgi:uncharacterized protein YkwD